MRFQFFSEEQKQKVLLDTKMFIEEIKNVFDIDCFLGGGMLLGSQREKDFIPHDRDIDVYYISKYPHHASKEALKEKNQIWEYFASKNRNKKIFNGESAQLHIWFSDKQLDHGNPGKTNMVDVFGVWIQNDGSYILSENQRMYQCKISDCILPLQMINFKGIEINAPNKIEDFLNFYYGKCWKTSLLNPKFAPGEIERAVLDGVLWEYWRGTKEHHQKLSGFGKKRLGYIKLDTDGGVAWCDGLHTSWKYENSRIILMNHQKTYELEQIADDEYATSNSELYIKIKKIMPNNTDPAVHSYFNKEITSEWFK